MIKKIIFIDLDDTLLTSDKKIGKESAAALKRALEMGHRVAIATGRSLSGTKKIMEELHLGGPGCYFLSFQGSMIYDCHRDKVLMNRSISPELVIDLMRELERCGIYAYTFNEREILTPRLSPVLKRYNAVTCEPVRVISDYEELRGEAMAKVIAIDYDDHEKLERFQRYYANRIQAGGFDSFFSCDEFLEYCRKDSNKGTGLEYLARYLRMPLSATIAVGDERNDIPMIEAAGIGVAMCNGRQEAKDAADYITERDNNHDGVAEVIERFMLQDHAIDTRYP